MNSDLEKAIDNEMRAQGWDLARDCWKFNHMTFREPTQREIEAEHERMFTPKSHDTQHADDSPKG